VNDRVEVVGVSLSAHPRKAADHKARRILGEAIEGEDRPILDQAYLNPVAGAKSDVNRLNGISAGIGRRVLNELQHKPRVDGRDGRRFWLLSASGARMESRRAKPGRRKHNQPHSRHVH